MTKSELIDRMVNAQAKGSGLELTSKDVELAVKTMLEQMSSTSRPAVALRYVVLAAFRCITARHVLVVTLKPASR